MKEEISYRTVDGKLFDTKQKAIDHEAKLAFQKWYDDGNELWSLEMKECACDPETNSQCLACGVDEMYEIG